MRAGGNTLALLSAPRTVLILQSLGGGPKGQLELRRDAGLPAQSTLRGQLKTLEESGAIVKHRRDSFPGTLEYELAEPGRELLTVAAGLEGWLAGAAGGPLHLGTDPARAAVKGLVEGWTTTVLTALAEGPLSLTELDKRISTVAYPSIERCLETMRLAEQLEVGKRGPKGTPHALTDWLRRGLAPLALAARWEHRHRPDGTVPISQKDVEGALGLATPLLALPARVSGICQMATRVRQDDTQRRFTCWIELRDGDVAVGPVHTGRKPDAWASSTADGWFATLVDGDGGNMRTGGDRKLLRTLVDRLHETLFKRSLRDVRAEA